MSPVHFLVPKVRVQRARETCPLCLSELGGAGMEFVCGCGVRYHAPCVEELGGACFCGLPLSVGASRLAKPTTAVGGKKATLEQVVDGDSDVRARRPVPLGAGLPLWAIVCLLSVPVGVGVLAGVLGGPLAGSTGVFVGAFAAAFVAGQIFVDGT